MSVRVQDQVWLALGADAAEEEAVIKWYNGGQGGDPKIRELAKPFINWLETAEESSDEESSD